MAQSKTLEVTLLGLVEASRRLGVCPATVKAYADDGLIPVLRDSARRRLFFSIDVEKFAQQRHLQVVRRLSKRV